MEIVTRAHVVAHVADLAGVGHLAHEAAFDELIDGVDRRRPGEADDRHGVAAGEGLGIPCELQHGIDTRAPRRRGRCEVGEHFLRHGY